MEIEKNNNQSKADSSKALPWTKLHGSLGGWTTNESGLVGRTRDIKRQAKPLAEHSRHENSISNRSRAAFTPSKVCFAGFFVMAARRASWRSVGTGSSGGRRCNYHEQNLPSKSWTPETLPGGALAKPADSHCWKTQLGVSRKRSLRQLMRP